MVGLSEVVTNKGNSLVYPVSECFSRLLCKMTKSADDSSPVFQFCSDLAILSTCPVTISLRCGNTREPENQTSSIRRSAWSPAKRLESAGWGTSAFRRKALLEILPVALSLSC
jgi:hypothetical protein